MDRNLSFDRAYLERILIIFCFIAVSGQSSPILAAVNPADAKVTYSGTNGLYNEVMNYNCNKCHQAVEDPSTAYYKIAPDLSTLILAQGQSSRIAARGGYTDIAQTIPGSMPTIATGVSTLSTAKRLIADTWDDDGALNYTNPAVDENPSESSQTSTGVTVTGFANDNGDDSSYKYQFSTNNSFSASLTEWTATQSNSGTGGDGSITSKTATATITDLTCNTLYYYRLVGRDAIVTSTRITNGVTNTYTPTGCTPVANNDNDTVAEGSSAVINVRANDTDADTATNSLIVSNISAATNGTLTNNNDGTITYLHNDSQTNSGSFTYTVNDGTRTSNTATVSITVTPVNDAPSITGSPASSVAEDTPYSFTPLGSDVDIGETATLLYAITNKPNWASFSTSTGALTGIPVDGDVGITTIGIVITVTDVNNASASLASFNLTVTNINDAPTITGTPSNSVAEDNAYSFTPIGNDLDDDVLTYSITNQPPWSSFSTTTGTLTGTPVNADVGSTSAIVISVRDTSNVSASLVNFNLMVTNTNDAPTITGSPLTSVEEESLYSFTPLGADVDIGETATLVYTITNKPSWSSFNTSTGALTGTPVKTDVGIISTAIVITVTDVNRASTSLASFSLTVTLLDTDADTVADYDDNCPDIANTEQEDLDADDIGDICDLDIDGDGIANVTEVANGLDPRDASDADEDLDGDGLTNLEEYQLCAANNDALCSNMLVDNNPPTISIANLTVPATGYVTEVELGASATDITDGDITPIADINGPFRPGRYTINWTATDTNNNVITAQQIVDVLPLASLSGSVATDEGQTINITFTLNGDAPDYPVTLNYTVTGIADATDHDLVAGSVQITAGQEVSMPVNILSDQTAESDEDFVITLATVSSQAILSTELNYTVRISEQNMSPMVALSVTQNNLVTSTVFQDLGTVNIVANATDGNGDTLTYDWSSSAIEMMATINGNSFSFDPAVNNLLPGIYPIKVSVSDGVSQTDLSLMINVVATSPVLSDLADSDNDGFDDATEGLGDSDNDGLLDYLDAVNDETLLHTSVSATADNYQNLLQTQRGFALRIGDLALQAKRTGAIISAQEVVDNNGQTVIDTNITNFGGISDFEIHGLTIVKPTAVVVLPLNQFVPDEGASYRKFINDSWTEFVVTGDDNVRSAKKIDGICPPPLDDLYQTGIAKFSECIELTLTDGGPNDTDGMVNGVIKDPGSVGVSIESNQPPPAPDKPTTSSGGSGQISSQLLWLLVMLLFIRIKNRRAP
ncbi:hypothetical protein CXF85_02420 [Colwellia sp. 75C3]|uniref:thrombospondin type 3 repeat-containing protein n=1 Tax=Colwellia sp. 75C3 TaxID=888425 RepID=UPI000C347303|nr:thrombospondin type 3 repeat-containing protein [Colwellia sp. 75C3]PKG85668.1 hypothetical protein CXF85_02420 [Colwellia sp. 75C3]